MPRQILIVDDIRSNREILKNILGDEYRIVEAAHGQEALAIMQRDYRQLSAVLLDLGMPVMDGFEVLARMRDNELLSQLPVIVTTGQTDSDSEERALQLGAKDYISKPYKSTIIKQRIWNTINLRETAATVNALQRDRLTGLYSREAFFEKVAELVGSHAPGYYVMTCFNIDNFKVINDQYGTETGDEVLRHVARCAGQHVETLGGICCRMTADKFAMLYPQQYRDSQGIAENHQQAMSPPGLCRAISVRIGRYIVADLSLSPSAMYDRAALAEDSVKGRYDQYIALYDESMRERLLTEQQLVTEMDAALHERQFEVWFQPQYNHSSGALIGAEALVRWRHPEKGLIQPAAFIPTFEKNGFIYELDKFVWEESCRYLKKWRDEGRRPLPLSVNVSRYDIFRPDLVAVLTGLIERDQIPAELLRLEITESAFAESTQQIVDVIKTLNARGFTVEIDDFGSGYSSLNTLKSVPAQVVKLDMRFLEDDDGSQRGGNILESVVRMTKWLGMSVIAEGVECREQADFLKSIGCSYVQGYLYARPMTAADYEDHCRGIGKEERLLSFEAVENLDNNTFWDPRSMDTLIFNSYVGAACIFEQFNGQLELLRANDKFMSLFGEHAMAPENILKLDWLSCLTPESRALVRDVLRRSAETGEALAGEYVFVGLPGAPRRVYLRATMRVIAAAGERKLIYCMSENITAQRQAEQSERRVAKQLQAVLENVNCGLTAITTDGEQVNYLLTNDRYYELLGYTEQQYRAEINGRAFETVAPEDRRRVTEVVERVSRTELPTVIEFRALRRDGSRVWLRSSISMSDFEGVEGKVQLSTYMDVSREKQVTQELLDNLPGGAALYVYDGETISAIHLNKRYWELVGRAPVPCADLNVLDSVHPDDRALIKAALVDAIAQKSDVVCDFRVRYGLSDYRLFHVVGRILPRDVGKFAINVTYTPVSDEALAIREMLPVALRAMMETQTDFSFVKDKNLRYVCASRAVYEAAGLQREAELIGKTDHDLLDRALAEQFENTDRRVMESGVSLLDQAGPLPSADGVPRYASTSKFPLRDSKGSTIGIYGIGRDITESRTLQSRLELLTNSIPGGIAVYEGSPQALERIRLTYFSDGFCRLFGYEREAYEQRAAQNALGLVFPDDLPALRAQVMRLVRDGIPMDCVYRARVNGSGFKWINIKATVGEPHGDEMSVNAVLFDVTERQETLEHLRVSEEENRLAIQHSGCIISRYSVADRTASLPPEVAQRFSLPEKVYDVPYGPVREGLIAPESQQTYLDFYEEILHGGKNGSAVYRERCQTGWRWIRASYSTIFSAEGAPVSAVVSFYDVSDELEKEAAYKRWQQSLQNRAAETYSLFRCNVNKDTVVESAEGLLLRAEFATGLIHFDEHTREYADHYVDEADRADFVAFLNIDAMLAAYYQGRRNAVLEYRELLPEGGRRWLRLTVDLVEPLRAADVEAYLLFENIDEAKRAELATREQAETDPLTGVLNRATFAARVNTLLRAASPGAQQALLMLDIDGFKQVNDAFGHSAGDQALIDLTESLRDSLRHGDLLGRLGGDEFMILLTDVPNDAVAAGKARQICALARRAFSAEVEISGSVGITIAPRDGADFETLYHRADAALYHVKGSGKDNYAFYHAELADEHLRPEPEPALKPGPETGATRAEKKRRMLIVDDSRIDHALLSNIFADSFIVEKAKDGNSALVRLRHYGAAISVVLLDLIMPGMDGFAVLEKMQQSAELRNIPVIVVSGDESRASSLRAIRAGAADFVTKPVDPEILRIRVQSAISRSENERLRAKNSFLEYQNAEVTRYRTVLERSGTVVIEHDWIDNSFVYDPATSHYLAGLYDGRKFWYILLADLVADTATVKQMQELVHAIAADRKRTDESLFVRLKTPSRVWHWFRFSVYKVTNEFGLTGKLYLALHDLGRERPADVADVMEN